MSLCRKCNKNPAMPNSIQCAECKELKKAEKIAYRNSVHDRYWSPEAVERNTRVILRDHATCQRCKIWNPNEILVVHHIIPVREGGSDDDNNLIALCKHCHSVLHHRKGATMDALFPGEEELLRERADKAIYPERVQPSAQSGRLLPNFFFKNGQMYSDTPGACFIDGVLYIFGGEEVYE